MSRISKLWPSSSQSYYIYAYTGYYIHTYILKNFQLDSGERKGDFFAQSLCACELSLMQPTKAKDTNNYYSYEKGEQITRKQINNKLKSLYCFQLITLLSDTTTIDSVTGYYNIYCFRIGKRFLN